jgi:hypothetical protein
MLRASYVSAERGWSSEASVVNLEVLVWSKTDAAKGRNGSAFDPLFIVIPKRVRKLNPAEIPLDS